MAVRKRNTPLNVILEEWDEKILPNGKQKVFSVLFCNKKGELQYVSRGVACGLTHNKMKNFSFKAVQPIDENNEACGHVIPVWIHAIFEFNNFKVI